jgi:hypothetical protein
MSVVGLPAAAIVARVRSWIVIDILLNEAFAPALAGNRRRQLEGRSRGDMKASIAIALLGTISSRGGDVSAWR